MLGLFANSEMIDAIEERNTIHNPDRTQPTLVEMATKAIELLDQNPKGFFLMVEGGQIERDDIPVGERASQLASQLAVRSRYDDAHVVPS